MALQINELSKNLLCSQAHIWNHIFSFIKSMSLKCAIQLEIPDIIDRHGSPMLLSELVEALAIKHERTQSVYRVMRILAGQEPRLNRFFNEAMASDARLVMSVVLEQCGGVFHGLDSIVDVGGGTGTVAKAIAKAFPDISCISFDLPHVVNGLVGSKNLTYVGGDMFEALPNANAVLLKWILHDWSDEECKKILKNCKEAIPCKEDGGKLVIIDMVRKVDEGDNELIETNQLFFDILMMTCLTGKERSEKEWAELFLDGGFSDYKITPILGCEISH
ncbi:hypothetical protein L1987_12208 [Smallanthus sonchifolius]|uniref:Uncharacterized protein n=1 Tax=Smallanthus sonchifolius TaxID=185202 RepID=A0ACB9JE13_9ASTR|nr:hypothetical protein L1987_12208 [Smallanthus sonchifolius]